MIPVLAQQIDALLPQTQCTKCGFDGCTPYAQAIADGRADFNQCPPGGQEGVVRLAHLLGRPEKPLDITHGVERARPLAVIDEAVCIGCTLCAKACPVDAIVGAPKLMHTVLIDACTGCDLCVAPCPVDCIEMVPVTGAATGWQAWTEAQAGQARVNHDRRQARLAAEQAAADARTALRVEQAAQAAARRVKEPSGTPGSGTPLTGPDGRADTAAAGIEATASIPAANAIDAEMNSSPEAIERARKQAIIQAAMARARQRRSEAAQADEAKAASPCAPDASADDTHR